MGFFSGLLHVADNMVAVNSLYAEVRKIVLANERVDIFTVPEPRKAQIYECIKRQYLDYHGSASTIAESYPMMVLISVESEIEYQNDAKVAAAQAQALADKTRALAEQGNGNEQHNLGMMYANGEGVTQDNTQAMLWLRRAADHGKAESQFELGKIYCNDDGGATHDYVQAAYWFRKAADQGVIGAQDFLGSLYAEGLGVPQDYAQAMMWLLIAKAGGDTLSDQGLQQLESLSTPAQIAEAQRMAREWLATHPVN